MRGILTEHHFITPLLCIEKGTVLDMLPADDNVIFGVPHKAFRIFGTHLIAMIPADKVKPEKPA